MIQNNPKRGKSETQNSLNSVTFATTGAAAALPICQQHLQPQSKQWKVINFSLLINSAVANEVLRHPEPASDQGISLIFGKVLTDFSSRSVLTYFGRHL